MNNEPFEFKTECLPDIVLYALYNGLQEYDETGAVKWIDFMRPLVNMLTREEKEYIAANVWKFNRKYYGYVSKVLNIKVDLSKVHR